MNDETPLKGQIIDIADIPAKYSATDALLAQLKERYAGFRIEGPEDTEAAKEADKARKRIKELRIETEKTRKELKAPALAFSRAVDKEAKRIKGVLEPLEKHLAAEYDKYEKAHEAIKEAERAEKIKRLLGAGFKFDGTYYVAGDALVHPSKIDEADDAQMKTWMDTGRAELKRLAEEQRRREEEERARKAEAARLAKEREELRREKERLARERREIEAARPKPTPKPAPQPARNGAGAVNKAAPPKPAPQPQQAPAPAGDDFDAGFETLRLTVIAQLRKGALPGGDKLTRANLIAWLQTLKPEHYKLPF